MLGKKTVFFGFLIATMMVLVIVVDLQGADSRHLMNLQGRLTDTSGNPTSGDHLFELRILNDASAGSLLYYEAQIVTINSGIYNVLVGAGNNSFSGTSPADYQLAGSQTGGIPATVFDREDLWLEVEIDQDNPLRPRTKVVSSAFAFRALKADSLVGNPGGGGGSAINISGSTITDAGGGAVMGRGRATAAAPNDAMSGNLVQLASITKTTDTSTLRVTYSDSFTRSAAGTLDCNWNITVGLTTVCSFGVGQLETDNSGTFTSNTSTASNTGTPSSDATNSVTSVAWWNNGGWDWGGIANRNWWGGGVVDNAHSHTLNAHTHSGGMLAHTHTLSLTSKDNWTSRLPVTRVCLGTGIPAGSYAVTVSGSGGSNCRASDGAVLLVDEVF